MRYPSKIILTEVGPRDGLQNEKTLVSTEQKLQYIDRLVTAGVQQIEVTSFVSPKWVPQMGDAAELYAKIRKKPGVRYIVLVPNEKGLENALKVGADALAVFTAASETFNQKNINATIKQSLQNIDLIVKKSKENKSWIRAYISTCFYCPYEGKIDPSKVSDLSLELLNMGANEISIGDTIGKATPKQVEELLSLLLVKLPADKIALHFHDTRGTALANVLQGLQMGINCFDASAGGLGGCPYAVGASGNLATEDLLFMLKGMGIESGVDLDQVAFASQGISKALNRTLPSKYLQAYTASRCS